MTICIDDGERRSAMGFEDVVAVLGQAFNLELKVVQDTSVFEFVSDDGSAKVQILLQDARERNTAFYVE